MSKEEKIEAWIKALSACEACALRREGNRGPTRFSGTADSPLMLVGEGPGGVEDIYGVPLVGPSGQLLDKALWSVGVTRDRIYVTNIVKCRPKANRTPSDEEGRFCADRHLRQEIALVRPSVIVALGKVALHYFHDGEGSIMRMRGQWLDWEGIPVMPTYHPAFLLRKTGQDLVDAKWQVYYDLKAAVEKANELAPGVSLKGKNITNLLDMYHSLKLQRQNQ